MTDLRKVLASNMRLHRKNLGLSQSKLADRVDSATNYIGMIETAKKFPSPEMMEKIAEALQIDSIQLFSMKPVALDLSSMESLRKDILADIKKMILKEIASDAEKMVSDRLSADDIDKLVSERLNEFREQAGAGA
jgi:transcriptional regulator with XRE-family HTH domain